MSHIVTIQTQVRDETAVRSACSRLKLPEPERGSFRLFSSTAEGLAVRLPEWRYPTVWDLTGGSVKYDNYGGRWGDPAQLDRFLQAYAVEKATLEARRRGHSVIEQSQTDGSIRLTVQIGGAA